MLKKITILEALNKCMTTIKEYIGLVADKKVDKVEGKCLTTNDLTDQLVENYNTAYNHSQQVHAPSNAQKNSDITKAEIEAKLTGQIDTHFHDLSEDLSEYDRRLDVSENKIENINQEITNTIKPTLNTHETKLNNIEAINTEQNNRLDAIEVKNQEQDNRINALETNDKIQDLNIKALFTTSDIMDIEEEGNSLSLHNSKRGFAIIDEIKGNTLVNCNKEPDKELILNGNINTSADNTVTLTEGVDGGLVDVALEGNTLVNVSKTKDDYITSSMEKVNQGSVISLPEAGYVNIDSIEGNTLVNYCTDGAKELTLNGDIDVEGTFVTTTEGVDNGLVDIMCEGNTLVNLMTDYKTESLLEYFYPVNNNDVANVSMLKPNTVYTLIYTAKYQKTGDDGCLVIQTTNNRGEDVYTNQNLTESYIQYSYRFTTLSSVNYFVLRATSNYFYIKECMLLEGDWTNKEIPQYFEGMKSVGQDDVNGHKVEIVSTNSDESLSNKKEILLNEPLRGLPNGVKDRFVKIGGKWFIERTYGETLLDGSGYVSIHNDLSETYIRYRVGLPTNAKTSEASNTIIWTKYLADSMVVLNSVAPGGDLPSNESGIYGGSALVDSVPVCYISIEKSKLTTSDEAGFKDWLSKNNIKIMYQLATPTYEPLEIEPTLNTYNDVTHISNNSIIPCNMQIKNTGYNAIIKPSTLYTVAVDTDKNGTIGINLGGAKVTTTNNVAMITTPETLTDNTLKLYGTNIKCSKVRLLEGDKTNWIPSFFEGMKSSFEDKVQEDGSYKMEILMNNENLINADMIIKANPSSTIETINGENWLDTRNSGHYGQIMNIFEPNTQYTLYYKGKTDDGSWGIRPSFYYSDGSTQGCDYSGNGTLMTALSSKGKTVVALALEVPWCFQMKNTKLHLDSLQLKKVNSANYVPNKSNKIQLSSIEPLRGVGDVHDRLVFKDGKLMIERNCASVTLNGSENQRWYLIDDTSNYVSWFGGTALRDTLIVKNGLNVDIYSDKLPGNTYALDKNREGICYNGNPDIIIGISKSKLVSLDNSGVNQWLSNNPLTVVYKLAEPVYEEIPYDLQKIILESYDNGTLFIDTNIPPTKVSFNCFEEELTYLYPATSYTVQFMSDKAITADIKLGGTSLLAQNIVVGLNRITITTPSELVDNKLVIAGAGAKISDVVVTDTNREFGYFEGMKSVGECEGNVIDILSQGKNLFDKDNINILRNTWIGAKNGKYGTMQKDEYENTLWIKVKPNTIYTITKRASYRGRIGACSEYPALGVRTRALGEHNTNVTVLTLTTTSTETYLLFSGKCEGQGYDKDFTEEEYFDSIQIEEGDISTEHTPYSSNTQQLTHEPLRGIGDVKDRYVLLDGKWYIERNCRELILNGTEPWNDGSYGGLTGGDTILFQINRDFSKGDNSTTNIITSRVIGVDASKNWNTDIEGISLNRYGSIQLRIKTSKLIEANSHGISTWLNSNNLKCVYKLETPVYEPLEYNPLEVYSEVTHISANSTIPCNVTVKNHGYNCILKPSTTYTVVSNQGVQNMTTPATLGDSLRFSGNGLLKDVMILEGTLSDNQIPGFFAGMESCYEQKKITDEHNEHFGYYEVTAKVVGKNLFNLSNYDTPYGGNIGIGDGSIRYQATIDDLTSQYGWISVDFKLKLKPNTTYVFKCNAHITTGDPNSFCGRVLIFIDDDHKYTTETTTGMSKIVTSKSGIVTFKFVGSWTGTKQDFDVTFSNIQLEEGDTATEYEPYKESVIKFYIKDPLRGIGEVKDKVFIQDDKVIVQRNCGSVTLDGSEECNWNILEGTDIVRFYTNELIENPDNIKLKNICDKFTTSYSSVNIFEYVYLDKNLIIGINKSKLQTQDLNGFKQWLSNNPLTIVYQLVEPTYEEVEYNDSKLYMEIFNNSTLFYNSNVPVTSKVHYSYSVPLVDKVTQTANISDEQDSMIIDLATQCAVMEIMLM